MGVANVKLGHPHSLFHYLFDAYAGEPKLLLIEAQSLIQTGHRNGNVI
jgi:hypothetical protein